MRTPTRLAAFGAGLVAVFAAAAGVGNAVGPVGGAITPGSAEAAAVQQVSAAAPGLAVADAGYALDVLTPVLPSGRAATFAFRVLGPDGAPVTGYTPTHDEELHLVVVRRDTTSFQHLHPDRAADGTWSLPLTLPTGGSYKVFADFRPADRDSSLTLAADVGAEGAYSPAPLPAVARASEVDGYTVELDGELVAGRESVLTLRVSRDGVPVTDLEPYLAAYGHLVALRAGDLAYLHVHPEESTTAGPELRFAVEVPTAGAYRLYLDVKHGGVVRTASFTATTSGTVVPPAEPEPAPAHDAEPHGH